MEEPKQARSVATLERILNAALIEFRKHGFRGASIASICKNARVSPGHLYHYFTTKEDIVAAIVERDRARIGDEIRQLLESADPVESIVHALLEDRTSDDFGLDPVMTLEIYAEATRNDKVAKIVRDFERHSRAEVKMMLVALREQGALSLEVDLDGATILLIALVDGLLTRRTADPETSMQNLASPLRALIGVLLGEKPSTK